MAREAGGLPYLGGNTSGVGAVYLDSGVTPNPIEMQLEQIKQSDVEYQRQQKQKAEQDKITQDLVADINPDTKGILESDVPYFQEKLGDLQKMTQDYLSMPNGVAKNQALAKLQYEKKLIETMVQGSVGDKAALTSVANALEADKDGVLDGEGTLTKVANLRAKRIDQRTPEDRSITPLPKPLTFDQNVQKFMTGKLPETNSSVYNKGGNIATQTVTEFTPEQLKNYANEFTASPKTANSANQYFDGLPDIEKQYYINAAGASGNPVAEAFKAYVYALQGKKSAMSAVKETEASKQAAKERFEIRKEDRAEARTKAQERQQYEYPIERLSAVLNDDPSVWTLTQVGGAGGAEKTISYVLAGTDLGKGTYVKDGKIATYPNKIVSFEKDANGKIGVVTTATLLNGSTPEPLTQDLIDKMIVGYKDPDKAREIFREVMIDKGFYDESGELKIKKTDVTRPKAPLNESEKATLNRLKTMRDGNQPYNKELLKSLEIRNNSTSTQSTAPQTTETKPNAKKYTIKGKEYSEEAVAKKAKDSGMTVQEYIDAINAMK